MRTSGIAAHGAEDELPVIDDAVGGGSSAATDLVGRPCFDSGAPNRDLARPLHGETLPTSSFSSLIIRFAQTDLHFDKNSLFYPKPGLLKPATSCLSVLPCAASKIILARSASRTGIV